MLSDLEKNVLVEVQRLPLIQKPFAEIASRLNLDEKTVLKICNDLLEKGVIRRFGPSISHRKVGFNANPMTAVKVPENRVKEIGFELANEPDVTHCYERSGWDYNIFFMIHSKTKAEGINRVKTILNKIGDYEYRILFSICEFKKISFEIQNKPVEVEK